MNSFDFLPRKVVRKSAVACPSHLPTQPVVHGSASVNVAASSSSSSLNEHRGIRVHATSKTAGQDQRQGREKPLDQDELVDMVMMAMSDYALWSRQGLREQIEASEDGFIPLSHILQSSPAFVRHEPGIPESTIATSLRGHPLLECRISVVEPDMTAWRKEMFRDVEVTDSGGFEIRRRDWNLVRERLRKYTAYQWEERTVYIENVPLQNRTVAGVHHFIIDLLTPLNASKAAVELASQPFLQGHAFVIFTQAKDARTLLEKWPWETHKHFSANAPDEPFASITSSAADDAATFTFRCLSKRQWDSLKGEYLALHQRLISVTSASSGISQHAQGAKRRGPAMKPAPEAHSPAPAVSKNEHSSESQTISQAYPPNCLVFVRNVHPDTSKTALRNLFSVAFQGSTLEIDYVDYTKGLDSCYLRLKTPVGADILVSYFSTRKLAQWSGLADTAIDVAGKQLKAIDLELVQGRKEEVYWDKVPEKIRRQALAKAYPPQSATFTGAIEGAEEDSGGVQRKRKQRKRG